MNRLSPGNILLGTTTYFEREARRTLTDLKCLFRMRDWHSLESRVPAINLELTNVCNAKCVFCGYQFQRSFRQPGFMSDDIFNKVLDEYREMGGGVIGVSPMCGEVLLDPKLLSRIERITACGFATYLFTNGLALHRVDLERFVHSGVSPVYISTAPMDAESLALIYRVHGFDDLIDGIVGLLSTRNRLQCKLRVEIEFRSHIPKREVLQRPVFREQVWPLLTDVERQRVQVQIVTYDSWGGMIKPTDLPGRMRLALPPRVRRRPCKRLFHPMVMFDGEVRLCACRFGPSNVADDRDALVIGNVREMSLQSILLGTRAQELRRSFVRGSMPNICRDCAHYEPC